MSSRWGKRSVSTTESFLSTFGFSYTFLALYMVANTLLFMKEAVAESMLHEDFQKVVAAIARGLGATINFNMAVVLLLASRSLLGFLRETPLNMVLPIDKAMPDFHRVVGKCLVFAGVLHSAMHWVTYIVKKPWSGGYTGTTSLFVSGMILLIVIMAIRIAARSAVYQSNYEVFFRIHVGGSIVAFITIIIHGLHHGVARTWKWVIGPIAVYVLDMACRSFREKKSYLLVSKHSAVFQGPDILKIRLPRVFHFQAGQYAELKVPELSPFQWHPFTIASAPHESEMVFYIKAVGDWTVSLYQLFSERISAGGEDIEVHIRGPFGASSQHVGQFDRVILVGGGVGATPFCSVVKDAYYWITNWTPQCKKRRVSQKNADGSTAESMHKQRDARRMGPGDIRGTRATEEGHDCGRFRSGNSDHGEVSSHILTTNVYTEMFDSVELQRALGNNRDGAGLIAERSGDFGALENEALEDNAQAGTTSTDGEYTLYTARDYLSPLQTFSSHTTHAFTNASTQDSESEQGTCPPKPRCREDLHGRKLRTGQEFSRTIPQSKYPQAFSRASKTYADDGMGSYRDNSSGPRPRSLDYISALYSAYLEEPSNKVYQRSLDMMVSLSFGSVSLVRNMQMKHAQRKMRHATVDYLPSTIEVEDLNVFHNPRIMFLLFMRSVTMNMVLLWVLLLRFVIAGAASIFNGVVIFEEGIALFRNPILNVLDLLLALTITLLVGIPSVLEVIELGAAPIYGFDLFVLTPVAVFGVVADILTLTNVGKDVNLLGVIRVFVLWPLLGILITTRLLRVIGERIAQAESLTHTHSSTTSVEFYWTAPSPDDDRWLVDELSPYADINSVKMHRYLTRCSTGSQIGWDSGTATTSLHTNYGRPNWNEILNEIAERCKNNTTIGVFFCGPHSMGADVQDACMGAMRNSIVRGLHSGACAMRGLEEVFGEAVSANEYTGETTDGKLAGARGCNVKFVFKRESFT